MKLKSKTSPIHEVTIDSTPINSKQDYDFIRDVVARGVLVLKPTFEKAGIIYPEVQEYFKTNNFASTKRILDSLLREGLFEEKSQERIIICPNCNSPEVYAKFSCPRCNSDTVELTQLLEHKPCGYIGPLADFSKAEELLCPLCSEPLSEATSYRRIGDFYQCEKCENRFDKPEVIHICQNCGNFSSSRNVGYIKVSTYKVCDNIVRQYMSELPSLEGIRAYLVNKGFDVRLHSDVIGISGSSSNFYLIAEKGSIRIVIDVSLQGNRSDIVAFLAKKIDVSPAKALLLDLSGGNELTELGKTHGIDVYAINAKNAEENQSVPKEFERLISNLINAGKG